MQMVIRILAFRFGKLVFYKKYLNEKCEIHHVILGCFLSL